MHFKFVTFYWLMAGCIYYIVIVYMLHALFGPLFDSRWSLKINSRPILMASPLQVRALSDSFMWWSFPASLRWFCQGARLWLKLRSERHLGCSCTMQGGSGHMTSAVEWNSKIQISSMHSYHKDKNRLTNGQGKSINLRLKTLLVNIPIFILFIVLYHSKTKIMTTMMITILKL